MKINRIQLMFYILVAGISSFLLTGCGTTQPHQFYILSSLEETEAKTLQASSMHKVQRIGVGPVKFPKYLDRSAMVLRGPDSEVMINETQRWAEPLKDNFTQVVIHNLQILLNNPYVTSLPWRNSKAIDYQVVIDVARFDANVNGNVVLSVQWTIRRKTDDRDLYSQKSVITEKAESNTSTVFVKKQSKLITQLSQEISGRLEEIMVQAK